MDTDSKSDKIELRDETIQELLGTPPGWFVRWGISVFFGIIIALLVGAYFFRYPQMIEAPIIITTEQPSVWVVAKSSGKIDSIYVKNQSYVANNQILAVIHNTADLEDVLAMKDLMNSLRPFISSFKLTDLCDMKTELQLGELQDSYLQLVKVLHEYKVFSEENFHKIKIDAVRAELEEQKKYLYNVKEQESIYKQSYAISGQQYKRDSTLFAGNAAIITEVEQSQQQKLSGSIQLNQSKLAINSCMISMTQLKQSINEYTIDRNEKEAAHQTNITAVYQQLHSRLLSWEQAYLLKSTSEGTVVFSTFWGKNQYINTGEKSFAIVPKYSGKIVGKCRVPLNGVGKVKKNQNVVIKLNEFPYMEFGMLQGSVDNISLVPVESTLAGETVRFNMVEISLPNSLKTNYGKMIPFAGELTGSAEIATKEMSLLEHLINPIKYLLSKKE